MGASILVVSCYILLAVVSSELIYPPFSASRFKPYDQAGSFLSSPNGTFKAAMFNPGSQKDDFYLCVMHVETNVLIWSANRDAPVSISGVMNMTFDGIAISDESGSVKWSTPLLNSSVYALTLTEMGNLVLLDKANASLWESFDYPTDTIVIGQRLPVGKYLSSVTSNYRLTITASDAVLQWQGSTYWKLSMDPVGYQNLNYLVEYMAINQTGLYLLGRRDSVVVVVIQLMLPKSNFRFAKLDDSGRFSLISFLNSTPNEDFVRPSDACRIPLTCGSIGLCSGGGPVCSCPIGFHTTGSAAQNTSDCVPNDGSHLPLPCNSSTNMSETNSSTMSVSYSRLAYGVDYFQNDFSDPVESGVNLSVCQNLCSADCSCLGVFYGNSTGSCYVLENELGSLISGTSSNRLGYIKVFAGSSLTDGQGGGGNDSDFPVIATVLLPFIGIGLLVAVGFLWWRRRMMNVIGDGKLNRLNSFSSDEMDAFSIPGLPVRFDFAELNTATENFKTLIGSGGFGSVYKGTLSDKTLVAVKKITNIGIERKEEFCTEIAIIGNIHHTNLVKLRGFCAQGRQRLLVYEYMNRGSLDRTLFGSGPVLEWQERFEIALGTARGLAYLHSGCERKIIHCDVKPENILLHTSFQPKISDFGLSKLLSPEQSVLFTTMRGTRGYLAPEWLTTSAISEKADVYGFGMVLLEIVSGRRNCPSRSEVHSLDSGNSSSEVELVFFPVFALDMHEQGRYLELADPRLEGRVESDEVERLVRVALCCAHEDPALRPNMSTVVGMLEGGVSLGEPRMESLNFLRYYGRRYSEASRIEQRDGESAAMLYEQANVSFPSTSDSIPALSYISSHHISGPR